MIRFIAAILFFLFPTGFISVSAQNSDPWDPFPSPNGRRQRDDDQIIRELMAKQQSEREKKEYAQLVERAELVEKLTAEIKKSLDTNGDFSAKDNEKFAEIQRLILKIRDGLGGSDDEDPEAKDSIRQPKSKLEAFRSLLDNVGLLQSEIKKSTRYSISVTAIERANSVLRLLKFLRSKD
ncbi:MAG: hypothetical protein C4324_10425 [Blastocatellia bacterium]